MEQEQLRLNLISLALALNLAQEFKKQGTNLSLPFERPPG